MADGGRGCSGRGNKGRACRPGRALAEIYRVLQARALLHFAGHDRSTDAPVPRSQDRLTVAHKTRACAVSCPAGSRPIAAPGGDACPVRQGLVHSTFVKVPIACYSAETSIGALAAIAPSTRGFTTSQGAEPGQVIRAGPESSREKAQCGESAGSLDAAEAGSGPGQGARPRDPRPRRGVPADPWSRTGRRAHSRCLEGCPGHPDWNALMPMSEYRLGRPPGACCGTHQTKPKVPVSAKDTIMRAGGAPGPAPGIPLNNSC
jgi:hypothetical protein